MIRKYLFIFISHTLLFTSVIAQITPEPQNAINSVPFAMFDYPANRDRSKPPQVASPVSFVFAYYHLPYAVNVNPVRNADLNTYVEYVLLDFKSVNLCSFNEKATICQVLPKTKTAIEKLFQPARRIGYSVISNLGMSYRLRFLSNRTVNQRVRLLQDFQIVLPQITSSKLIRCSPISRVVDLYRIWSIV